MPDLRPAESRTEYQYVWICKKCLRVSKLNGYEHATAPDKMDLCKGKWVRRPIW